MKNEKITRGEIFLADLNPAIGSEQNGIRPVLILQNNVGNRNSKTVIAAPITTKKLYKSLPVHVFLTANIAGIKSNSCVLLEQIRVLDKCRLIAKLGRVSQNKMKIIDNAVRISVGLKSEFNM